MQCKQCGIENKDSAKFCKACGASLRETPVQTSNFCPACGTENSVKAVYCKSCGEKLQSIEPISDAVLETSFNADELQQSEQITEPNISEQELQQPEQEYTEPSPQQSVPVYKDVHNAETIEIDQAQFDQTVQSAAVRQYRSCRSDKCRCRGACSIQKRRACAGCQTGCSSRSLKGKHRTETC